MKKISIIVTLALIISLTGCGSKTTSTDDIKASSEITSSGSVSSDVVDDESSSTISSNPIASSKAASSKAASSKAASSKAVSSKATSSKAVSSKATSSKAVSSKAVSSKATSSISQEPTDASQFNASTIEQMILVLVNQERSSLGLSNLTWSNTLYKSAKIRSDEMAEAKLGLNISHTRPNGEQWSTALTEVGYSEYYAYAGENLAAMQNSLLTNDTVDNQSIADKLFDGWKNSPGHYAAIIRPETIEIGIAVTRDGTNLYATQHFGQIK
ncbi:MAG: CAP domain-containing protein [Oscillospiraceae bacterium]